MRSVAPLTCLACLLATSPAMAGSWYSGTTLPVAGMSPTASDASLQAAALAHLGGRRPELGLDGVELSASKVQRPRAGSRVVRFEQSVNGVPVIGTGVVLRIGEDGSIRRIGVDVRADLEVDTVPDLS